MRNPVCAREVFERVFSARVIIEIDRAAHHASFGLLVLVTYRASRVNYIIPIIHIMEMTARLWQISPDAKAAARIPYATPPCGNCGISTMETSAHLWQIL